MTRKYNPLVDVVGYMFRMRGIERAPNGLWAAEMKAAKDLMEADPKLPEDQVEVYTADEIKGCIRRLREMGITVKTLRLFFKDPRILVEYAKDQDGFSESDVPDWLLSIRNTKRRVYDKLPENF